MTRLAAPAVASEVTTTDEGMEDVTTHLDDTTTATIDEAAIEMTVTTADVTMIDTLLEEMIIDAITTTDLLVGTMMTEIEHLEGIMTEETRNLEGTDVKSLMSLPGDIKSNKSPSNGLLGFFRWTIPVFTTCAQENGLVL